MWAIIRPQWRICSALQVRRKLALAAANTSVDYPELVDRERCFHLARATANTGVGHPECVENFAESFDDIAKQPESAPERI